MSKFNCGSFLFLMICSHSMLGQSDSVVFKKIRWTPLPVVYYSPETRLGFGGLVATNMDSSLDSLTTSSYAQSFFLYTTNRQYNWDNTFRYYTPQNKFIFQGRLNLTYFPESYFGIETEQPRTRQDMIEYNRLSGEFKGYRVVHTNVYGGLAARYSKIYNLSFEPGGSFSMDKPVGYKGYQIIGFAPVIAFESRDSQVYPSRGMYAEMQLMIYPEILKESFHFINIRIDTRKYYSVNWTSTGDVIALQLFTSVNSGKVPFKEMADIGGSVVMRGYYSGYYRFKNLYAFQAEYRTGLWKFIGINFWLGVAMTPKVWYRLNDSSVKPNVGVGLRFMINENDKLNIRADFGFGKQQQRGFYLDIAEAF